MALLSEEEIEAQLAGMPGWERDGDTIAKIYELADFVGSVEFINKLVAPAEEMNHHPDLAVSWSRVTVSITNHEAGGLTAADFTLAGQINAL